MILIVELSPTEQLRKVVLVPRALEDAGNSLLTSYAGICSNIDADNPAIDEAEDNARVAALARTLKDTVDVEHVLYKEMITHPIPRNV